MNQSSCHILDGRLISNTITNNISSVIKNKGYRPKLTVILLGENPASAIYVKNKQKKAEEIGIKCTIISLPNYTTQSELINLIHKCNNDAGVDGIIIQMPLPPHIDPKIVIREIKPEKDVDGFHPINTGILYSESDHRHLLARCHLEAELYTKKDSMSKNFAPCTALGVLHLVTEALGEKISGKKALIIGRSNIVGKPTAALLLSYNCTVTIAHSHTKDLDQLSRNADILVAAVGKANFVQGDWIKPGSCIIDVGINREEKGGESKILGDVDYHGASKKAGWITTVPGGVGPMTIAYLMHNTLCAHLHTS